MKISSRFSKSLLCLLFFFSVSPLKAQGEFSLIPAGAFTMGNEGSGNDFREVYVSAFCIGRCEVTKAQWDMVRTWANGKGYDLAEGLGKSSEHPLHSITWYDVVKWCNARSEKEGLEPFYYTDDAQTTIYRSGTENITNARVKWTANGYRLPTEAEWEKAARGGLEKKLYPWSDTISHDDANYYDNGHHPIFKIEPKPYTSPCEFFKPNGFELYDVAGNVHEWCWDKYGNVNPTNSDNPKGPDSKLFSRVYRGGSWDSEKLLCQVGYRYNLKALPSHLAKNIGFRLVTTPRITSSMAKVELKKGKVYRYAIQTNFGATTFTAPGRPDGLSLRSTGVIAGTPKKDGTYTVTITAKKLHSRKVVGTAKATKVFEVK